MTSEAIARRRDDLVLLVHPPLPPLARLRSAHGLFDRFMPWGE